MKKLLAAFLLSSFSCAFAQSAPQAAPDKKLPRVLIIGDSISIGYTPFVVAALKDKAIVKHHKGNAGPTLRGIQRIDAWLGKEKWDVIQFNWGLWDMYRWSYRKYDQSPEAYEKNLESLVSRLEKTGAKLIWATSTPICPKAEKKSHVLVDPAGERAYLETARRVMKKHHIAVNDLHAFMAPRRKKYALADNDVHYTKEGYQALADQVVAKIKETLKDLPPTP